MEKINILWADDEIDLLKPHLLFLEEKGYEVMTAKSGDEAIEIFKENHFDLVLLDENMPGLSGLETLSQIKNIHAGIPVVMVTKSEEESIMEDAIGSKISDYLIKPVNPKQLLLSLKKNLDHKRLVSEKTTSDYQQQFRNIGMRLGDRLNHKEWTEIYQQLVYWELELAKSNDDSMSEIIDMQKKEANTQFSRFVEDNYLDWVNNKQEDVPIMSHTLLKSKVLPLLEKDDESVLLLVIDNLRYDQWKVLQPVIEEYYRTENEATYYSILPTATQYARNAMFAGLMPSEIQKLYPKLWLNDHEEGGKNMHEEEFLAGQIKRWAKDFKCSYNKITKLSAGKKLVDNFNNLSGNKLNVIVYNFVDMLSHARTDMEVIRELASDESAYRSLTLSWFKHSPLHDIVKQAAAKKMRLIITTDHGTIRVQEPSKVVGDKNTNSNLRYKQGKSLDYNSKEVLEVKNPADAFLPKVNVSSTFIFAKEDKFFAYPNNYNYYVNYYRDTFQHGGISLEEIIVPIIILSAK